MKPAPFDYIRAESVEEALVALVEAGDDAAVLAGGLSLVAMMNMRLARPELLVDINGLAELATTEVAGGRVRTGALLRQAEAMGAAELTEAVPLLARALPNVGHFQTRSRGTLAGSVAHADPSAEVPLCLATLGGEIELASTGGTRRIAARDFAEAALATARQPDEMIVALLWPVAGPDEGTAFAEVSQRHGDFAIVAAAARVVAGDSGGLACTLGLGGVEDRPRVFESGPDLDVDRIDDFVAACVSGLTPMQDPKADAAYRAHLARHLGRRVLTEAVAEAGA